MQVYKNDVEWWVAESLDDCWQLFAEHTGLTREECEADDPFEPLDPSTKIRILCERNAQGEWEPSDQGEHIERTAAEWATSQGRGMLCTTEF